MGTRPVVLCKISLRPSLSRKRKIRRRHVGLISSGRGYESCASEPDARTRNLVHYVNCNCLYFSRTFHSHYFLRHVFLAKRNGNPTSKVLVTSFAIAFAFPFSSGVVGRLFLARLLLFELILPPGITLRFGGCFFGDCGADLQSLPLHHLWRFESN